MAKRYSIIGCGSGLYVYDNLTSQKVFHGTYAACRSELYRLMGWGNLKDGNFSNLLYNFKIMEQIVVLNRDTAIRANVITRRTNARLVDGISKALLIEQLKKKLRSGQIVKFAYLKRNGSIRIAYGTTAADFIADKVCGWGESRENYACCAYFDLEKGWRSFRWENLIAVY